MPEEEPKQEAPKESGEPAGAKAPAESAEMPSSLDNLASPEAKFTILVSSIATQTFVGLGLFQHPITKKKEVNLDTAKYSIDLLQVLAEKTRGNLTEPEKKYLADILYDLRMRFVEASRSPSPKKPEEAKKEE